MNPERLPYSWQKYLGVTVFEKYAKTMISKGIVPRPVSWIRMKKRIAGDKLFREKADKTNKIRLKLMDSNSQTEI